MNILPMALVLVLLTGCATAPKPVLPEAQYSSAAWEWYAVSRCGTLGKMDLATASLGKTYLQSSLNEYVFDSNKMQAEINQINTTPEQEQCNALAMKIINIKQRIAVNNEQVELNQRATQEVLNSTKIKNTYCNKIGSQLFCNTY